MAAAAALSFYLAAMAAAGKGGGYMSNPHTQEIHSGTMQVMIEGYNNVINEINDMRSRSEKVVSRTIADFKSRGPSWVSQEVAKEYNIKKADVNEARTKGAKRGRSSVRVHGTRIEDAVLVYRGRVMSAVHFGMKPVFRPQRGPYTVTALIKKSEGRKALGSDVFLGTPMHSNGEHDLPFQRDGADRLPIHAVYSVSVPQMIENDVVSENIHERINKELGKRLEHHLKQLSR